MANRSSSMLITINATRKRLLPKFVTNMLVLLTWNYSVCESNKSLMEKLMMCGAIDFKSNHMESVGTMTRMVGIF
jgi:hypothetical protein